MQSATRPETPLRSSTQSAGAAGPHRCPQDLRSLRRPPLPRLTCPPPAYPRISPPFPRVPRQAVPHTQRPPGEPRLPVLPPRLLELALLLVLRVPLPALRPPAPPSPHHSAEAVLCASCGPARPPPKTCSIWDRRPAAPSPSPSSPRNCHSVALPLPRPLELPVRLPGLRSPCWLPLESLWPQLRPLPRAWARPPSELPPRRRSGPAIPCAAGTPAPCRLRNCSAVCAAGAEDARGCPLLSIAHLPLVLTPFRDGSPDTRLTIQSAATRRSLSLWLRCGAPMAVATRSASAAMKVGESFNPADISNCVIPNWAACSRASWSTSPKVSTWSETKDIGTTQICRSPSPAAWRSVARSDGCSHLLAPTLL